MTTKKRIRQYRPCQILGCKNTAPYINKVDGRRICCTHRLRFEKYGNYEGRPEVSKFCSIEGCERKKYFQGVCSRHWKEVKGDREVSWFKECSFPGCKNQTVSRGLCGTHKHRVKLYGSPYLLAPKKPMRLCSLPGCAREHKGHGLCNFHLNRKKAGTPLDFERPPLSHIRYKMVSIRDHPLTNCNGQIPIHRKVLYDFVEGSSLPCIWCGKVLEWKTTLLVDHLDHNRHNNVIENLVPSCKACNSGRTRVTARIFSPAEMDKVEDTLRTCLFSLPGVISLHAAGISEGNLNRVL